METQPSQENVMRWKAKSLATELILRPLESQSLSHSLDMKMCFSSFPLPNDINRGNPFSVVVYWTEMPQSSFMAFWR